MKIIELPEYIQWNILNELEDPGFNINWRRLMCTCKYYRNLIKNTEHLSKKICPKVNNVSRDFSGINYIIYFDQGYIGSISQKVNLNSDRRKWGDLYNFILDVSLSYNLIKMVDLERISSVEKYSNKIKIKVPDCPYLANIHIVIFSDDKCLFNLICSRTGRILYKSKLLDLDFSDPITILNETYINDRWEFLNDIEIIEIK